MINAQELRIGNKLLWHSPVGATEIEVDIDTLIMINDGDAENFYPIPLTPDILEKAGFNTGHSNYYFKNGIEINIKDEELDCIGSVPLKYMHQLQNLYFALTGEELNIEL